MAQRPVIERYLHQRVRLSKVRTLLRRQGVSVSYATLRRFAMAELGFGATASTIPVADCGPGEEVQLDTGWMTHVAPDATGRRRRFRAWIFTAVLSRYRFVYPVFRETTETAIEACEAAWAFFHGIFRVLIPDNTESDRPARGSAGAAAQSDLPRVRPGPRLRHRPHPRAPRSGQGPCGTGCAQRAGRLLRRRGGDRIDHARVHARHWCVDDYGPRRHSRTLRAPREHFETVEQPALRPAPTEPYDIPLWGDPKSPATSMLRSRGRGPAPDPVRRPDPPGPRRSHHGALLRWCRLREGPSADARWRPRLRPSGLPGREDRLRPAGRREPGALGRGARPRRRSVCPALLAGDLPWTRMRQVYALLGLARRYGDARVNAACDTALAVEMLSVRRLARLLELATPPPAVPPARVLPLARDLRPATHYALPLAIPERRPEGGDPA